MYNSSLITIVLSHATSIKQLYNSCTTGVLTMVLMNVEQYAKLRDISRQAVYSLIKRNKIEWIVQNSVKMIKVYDKTVQQDVQQVVQPMQQDIQQDVQLIIQPYTTLIKHLKKQIRELKKQIKKIENNKDKNYERLEKLFDKVLEVKQLSAPVASEIIDNEVVYEVHEKKKGKK